MLLQTIPLHVALAFLFENDRTLACPILLVHLDFLDMDANPAEELVLIDLSSSHSQY